jgi:hypothetical protein
MSKRNFKWKVFFRLLKEDLCEAAKELRFWIEARFGAQMARRQARQRQKKYEQRQAQYQRFRAMRYRLQHYVKPFASQQQSEGEASKERKD